MTFINTERKQYSRKMHLWLDMTSIPEELEGKKPFSFMKWINNVSEVLKK